MTVQRKATQNQNQELSPVLSLRPPGWRGSAPWTWILDIFSAVMRKKLEIKEPIGQQSVWLVESRSRCAVIGSQVSIAVLAHMGLPVPHPSPSWFLCLWVRKKPVPQTRTLHLTGTKNTSPHREGALIWFCLSMRQFGPIRCSGRF